MRVNEIADKLARSGSVRWFVGRESFLGVSRHNIHTYIYAFHRSLRLSQDNRMKR